MANNKDKYPENGFGFMESVTSRAKSYKQPRGGLLPAKSFECIPQSDDGELSLNDENVHSTLIGLSVDYLTRYLSGTSPSDAFVVARKGASFVDALDLYDDLLSQLIPDIDNDGTIVAAIRLSGFDSVARTSNILAYNDVRDITPDAVTISHVRTMVKRSLRFLESYGPKILDGLTFEGGYTLWVATGDGDFLTADTLWDFKVSKNKPDSKQTLQLLMYWRMGMHSRHPEYGNVRYLGIYNPRKDVVYRISCDDIPFDVIDVVDSDVIGYV